MTFNYQRYGSYIGNSDAVSSKKGRFDLNASQLIGDMSPVFVTTFHSGVIAGGTSQTNYSNWAYNVTMPALTYGFGDRYVFFMTGTRDANGVFASNRPPVLDGPTAYFGDGTQNVLPSNWAFSVEGHSDYNNIIIGGIQTDAVGSTTFTMNMDYTISQGGSDYMFLIVIDGISSVTASTASANNSASTSSIALGLAPPATAGSAQLRLVGGSSSNSGTANPFYNIDAGQTGAGIGPYTTAGQGENGTSERYGVFYDYDASGGQKTTNIAGTVSVATAGSNGLGYAAAVVNIS